MSDLIRISWNHKESPETYTVLPGEECVIGIQTKGKISLGSGEQPKALAKAGITGILRGPRTFFSEKNTKSLLVYISPLLLSRMISVPMDQISDSSLSLEDLFSREMISGLVADCEEADSKGLEASQTLEKFRNLFTLKEEKEKFLPEAVLKIKSSFGEIGIKGLAEDLGVSQSSLERGFKSRIGLSPKEYAGLIRFRNIFRFYNSSSSLTELALEAGYYDQAHFIREFKKKTGVSPKQWFRQNTIAELDLNF
ncbi:helix-turn-helix domain-containing protein [Leptospira andrefontaineae]|uniref:AraC family transcriptional regulator n=1 Tax=Leptospira andrefontaineae TaxID=2484976 RepID=A0A4R9H5H5_9LEPT|nr:helix-turn-helix domain-containing protein [Leptospira andrefontaineae]TGK40349.1 AraC family transcriptional regulator [Leptospira andrefontaineae]